MFLARVISVSVSCVLSAAAWVLKSWLAIGGAPVAACAA